MNRTVFIRPFVVPTELGSLGLTGEAVARMFTDWVHYITQDQHDDPFGLTAGISRQTFSLEETEEAVVEVLDVRFGIRQTARLFLSVLFDQKTTYLTADLTLESPVSDSAHQRSQKLPQILTIRARTSKGKRFDVRSNSERYGHGLSPSNFVDEGLRSLAEMFVGRVSPLSYAAYLASEQRSFDYVLFYSQELAAANNVQAALLYCLALSLTGDTNSIERVNTLVASNSHLENAYFIKARVLSQFNRFDEAIDTLKALGLRNGGKNVAGSLFPLLLEANKFQEAQGYLAEALGEAENATERDVISLYYAAASGAHSSVDALLQNLRSQAISAPDAFIAVLPHLIETGDFRHASTLIERVPSTRSSFIIAMCDIARAKIFYRTSESYPKALHFLQQHRLLQRYPDLFLAAMADLSLEAGNLDNAMTFAREALDINPWDTQAYFHYGQALSLQENWKKADEIYRDGLLRDGYSFSLALARVSNIRAWKETDAQAPCHTVLSEVSHVFETLNDQVSPLSIVAFLEVAETALRVNCFEICLSACNQAWSLKPRTIEDSKRLNDIWKELHETPRTPCINSDKTMTSLASGG